VLLHHLIERDVPIRLALLAALAGEHLLLLGPPGTAKSEMAQRLKSAFADATYFERLLTRFSVPEELFGPMSIKALENDRYERKIEGYLPTASIAFLDEIFKANSAILNSLLTLLNERAFDNGVQRIKTPLISAIGASNELPEGPELEALYDRFLLRCYVGPVTADGFGQLLELRGSGRLLPDESLLFHSADLILLQQEAQKVRVPEDVQVLLNHLREWLQKQDIFVSDRRWRKIVSLLQMSAYTNGRDYVSMWDGWLLQHCTWQLPEQREKIRQWYDNWVGATDAAEPKTFLKIIRSWEQALQRERDAQAQACDDLGNLLFYDANGEATTSQEREQKKNRSGELLYLAPDGWFSDRTNSGLGYTQIQLEQQKRDSYNYRWPGYDARSYFADPNSAFYHTPSPLMEPMRYSKVHKEGKATQVSNLLEKVERWVHSIQKQISTMEEDIEGHLWIEPGYSQRAKKQLDEQLANAESLSERCRYIKEGFLALPEQREFPLLEREETLEDAQPW
jgi:MoxR-like ATPase